jgi:hypothetical protein
VPLPSARRASTLACSPFGFVPQTVRGWTSAAVGSRIDRAYSPSVRTSTIVMAMKIRPSVMAATVTWWVAHHWTSWAGNQFEAP